MICSQCNKEFTKTHNRQKLCSKECSKINNKEWRKKYRQTDKAKEASKKYNKLDKAKEAHKKYHKSKAGKKSNEKSDKKYQQSAKYLETVKKLNYIPVGLKNKNFSSEWTLDNTLINISKKELNNLVKYQPQRAYSPLG